MSKTQQPEAVGHIYAQEAWHDDAYIIGNRTYLKALRKAIDRALQSGSHGRVAEAFASDGEGYATVVVLYDHQRGEKWDRLALPYTDEAATEKRPKGYFLGPVDLFAELLGFTGIGISRRG